MGQISGSGNAQSEVKGFWNILIHFAKISSRMVIATNTSSAVGKCTYECASYKYLCSVLSPRSFHIVPL